MSKKIEELLQNLREAMHEALANSWDVAAAMTELEFEGCYPTLMVDVTLADDPPSSRDQEDTSLEKFVLTDHDQRFLRTIKVANPV